jgi:hypothetical protein
MANEGEEILLAESVYSDAEVLAEFQEQCEEAAEMPGNPSLDLQLVAKALISVLLRRDNS